MFAVCEPGCKRPSLIEVKEWQEVNWDVPTE